MQEDGEAFTTLMDDLLRASILEVGLPLSDLLTNQRIHYPDGGVDTEMRSAVMDTTRDRTGWLHERSAWQYKARDREGCRKELATAIDDGGSDRYVKQKTREGFAYRYCVTVSLPPSTITEWEEELTAQARRVHADARPARVLTAAHIASWVNCYPSLVRKYFRPRGANVLDHASWLRTTQEATPRYVPVGAWETARARVLAHADLARNVENVLLSVSGASGVGKTRLICEALQDFAPHVVYTDDQNAALSVAFEFQGDPSIRAVIVSDECDRVTSAKIERLLQPHADRLRVIAIDNSAESYYRQSDLAPL